MKVYSVNPVPVGLWFSSVMIIMVGGGGTSCFFIILTYQQPGSLLIHSPGLDSLDQIEEVLLTLWNWSNHIIQISQGAPLVLHPVRLQRERDRQWDQIILHGPLCPPGDLWRPKQNLLVPGSESACSRSPDLAEAAGWGCRFHTEQLVLDQAADWDWLSGHSVSDPETPGSDPTKPLAPPAGCSCAATKTGTSSEFSHCADHKY